ncbi:MAG TPA: hypothetical protein DD434_03735 [Bacteroidales bacterium]|nr:hypothetical protein [Bacteroidales bacterium]
MKSIIKYLLVLILFTPFFISCSKENENEKVNKVVVDYYSYFNSRDFKNMRILSTKNGEKYVEIIQSIGNDIIKLDTFNIIKTNISEDSANVYVKTIDTLNNITYVEWILKKEKDIWKIDDMVGVDTIDILTDEDIKYSKIDHVRNAMLRDSLKKDSLKKRNLKQ